MEHSLHFIWHTSIELVRTLVLGEPPVISLLDTNSRYSKDVYAIREKVHDAIRRGDMERAIRIFLDGVMRKEGFFINSHITLVPC
jgi:hypothetical protein